MRASLRAILIASLVAMISSAGTSYASQREGSSYVEAVFDRGETLEFTLSWLRLVGGTATMSVTPSADGEQLTISSLAQSNGVFSRIFKVRDVIESVVDRKTFSTLRFHKMLNERNRIKEETTVVDPARRIATRKGREIEVPQPIFDPLSTIFYIRKLDLSPGRKHYFNILADGKMYLLEALVVRREYIRTDAGMFKTVVVEPKMHSGGIFRDENIRLLIWYSDDERHMPVRIRSDVAAGSITASLRAFRVGAPAASRSAARSGKRK